MLLDYLIWLLVVLFYKSFEISNLKLNTNASLKFQNRQVHLSFTTCNIDYSLITSDFLPKTILQNYLRKLFQKSQNSFQNYFENSFPK